MHRSLAAALLLVLAVTLGGCGSSSEAASDPVTQVAIAARETIRSGPASMAVSVSSPTTEYALRGRIKVATDTYRARVRVQRARLRRPRSVLRAVGRRGASFEVKRRCWLDPHAPVGSFGGATSVQETLVLIGVSLRLLRDSTRSAAIVAEGVEAATTYAVEVDERKAKVPRTWSASDELWVIRPRRLARQLASPIAVTVNGAGQVSRLSLKLSRFSPIKRPPSIRRGAPEPVSIDVSLGDFGRALHLDKPNCLAVE